MHVNKHYADIKESYLFSDIAKRVNDYIAAHPDNHIIRLGIGDVTRPICPAAVEAMRNAASEVGTAEGFHGYGPEQGYGFIKSKLSEYYKNRAHVELSDDEIFISDGAKSDVGNILDLFDQDNLVLVPDPVYPVYVDTNLMAGRKIAYMNANAENGFLPLPDASTKGDIIYICSPNNPTGAAYNREQLKKWVDFANANDAVILYDSAYEAFSAESDLPLSIYEIEGAKTCAIEFCSLSKTAGFTGIRCGYTVVPDALVREGMTLRKMWLRRQTTKFNGVSYIVQRGAEAIFTPEGLSQIHENINYYRKNAEVISSTMDKLGIFYTGGKNSPYVWFQCPNNMKSWEFFDKLLNEAEVVGTPGAGFGTNGEGFFRLTSFNTYENTVEAMKRFESLFSK